MLQRGNAYSVAPAASAENYFKFAWLTFTRQLIEITNDYEHISILRGLENLPLERLGRHSNAGALERVWCFELRNS